MKTITFEVTVAAPDAGKNSDEAEVENIVDCVMDSLGYPDKVIVTAKVLRRGDE